MKATIGRRSAVSGRAARRLEDVGDVNCWAGANRELAKCEATLGDPDPARERLSAVIERMPVLPMQEIAKPRTLDSAADVFFADGRYDEAGVTLGVALAAELPAEYQRQRDPELREMRDHLAHVLGEPRLRELTTQGESLGLDEALAQTRTWLAIR